VNKENKDEKWPSIASESKPVSMKSTSVTGGQVQEMDEWSSSERKVKTINFFLST
jgi:hypothetical protein